MATKSNNSLPNIILLATLSTSVLNLPYNEPLIPARNHNYSYGEDIAEWKDLAFNIDVMYSERGLKNQKTQSIVEFSKKVINNSKDIDGEFVDIVNDNFWDLI